MNGCDAVIHLAGKFNQPHRRKIYTVNVLGTANVVQAMHTNGIKKIIFTSSVGASERYYNAYDDSKFIAEKILMGTEYTILRLSNLYGRDQKDKLVTNIFKASETGTMKVMGDGKQTRDLVHVEDVVRAILKAIKSNTSLNQ